MSVYGAAVSSISSEEVQEWVQTGPGSMTKWIAWQPSWRLFDFDFLLTWGGRYGPALHQGQWWRWVTWGNCSSPLCCCPFFWRAWLEPSELLVSSVTMFAASVGHVSLCSGHVRQPQQI